MNTRSPSLRLSDSRRSSATFTLGTDLATANEGDLFDLDFSLDATSDGGGLFGSSLFAELDTINSKPASRRTSSLTVPRRQRRRSSVSRPVTPTTPTIRIGNAVTSRNVASPRWRKVRVLMLGALRFCQSLRENYLSPYHTDGVRVLGYLLAHSSTDVTGIAPSAKLLRTFCEENVGQASALSSSAHISSLTQCIEGIAVKLRPRVGLPEVPYGAVTPARQGVRVAGGSCEPPPTISEIVEGNLSELDYEGTDGCLKMPTNPPPPVWIPVRASRRASLSPSWSRVTPMRGVVECAASLTAALASILSSSPDARAAFVSRCDLHPSQAPLDGVIASCLIAQCFQPQAASVLLSAGCAAETDVTFAEMDTADKVDGYSPLSPQCLQALEVYGISNNLLVVCGVRASLLAAGSASPTKAASRGVGHLQMAGECLEACVEIQTTLLRTSHKAAPLALRVAAGAMFASALVAELYQVGLVVDANVEGVFGGLIAKASNLAARAQQDVKKLDGGTQSLAALYRVLESVLLSEHLPNHVPDTPSASPALVLSLVRSVGELVKACPALPQSNSQRLADTLTSLAVGAVASPLRERECTMFEAAIQWAAVSQTPSLAAAVVNVVSDPNFIESLLRARRLDFPATVVALLEVLPRLAPSSPEALRALFQLVVPILEAVPAHSSLVPCGLVLKTVEALVVAAEQSSWSAVFAGWASFVVSQGGKMDGITFITITDTPPRMRSRCQSVATIASFDLSLEQTPRGHTFTIRPTSLVELLLGVVDPTRAANIQSAEDPSSWVVATVGCEVVSALSRARLSPDVVPIDAVASALDRVLIGGDGKGGAVSLLSHGAITALVEASLCFAAAHPRGHVVPRTLSLHVQNIFLAPPDGPFNLRVPTSLAACSKLGAASTLIHAAAAKAAQGGSFSRTVSHSSSGTAQTASSWLDAYSKLLADRSGSALYIPSAPTVGSHSPEWEEALVSLAAAVLLHGVARANQCHASHEIAHVLMLEFVERIIKAVGSPLAHSAQLLISTLATRWAECAVARSGGSITIGALNQSTTELGWRLVEKHVEGGLSQEMATLRACIRRSFLQGPVGFVDALAPGSEQTKFLLLQLASSPVVTRLFSLSGCSSDDGHFWKDFVEGVVVKAAADETAARALQMDDLRFAVGKMRAAEASAKLWEELVEARVNLSREELVAFNEILNEHLLRPTAPNKSAPMVTGDIAASTIQKTPRPTMSEICVGTEEAPSVVSLHDATSQTDVSLPSKVPHVNNATQCEGADVANVETQCDATGNAKSQGTQCNSSLGEEAGTQANGPDQASVATQCHPQLETTTSFIERCLSEKRALLHLESGGGSLTLVEQMCSQYAEAHRKMCAFLSSVLGATPQAALPVSEDSFAEALRVKSIRLVEVERRLRDADDILADALEPHLEINPLLSKMQRVVRDRNAALAAMERDVERLVDVWRRKVDILEAANRSLLQSEKSAKAEVGHRMAVLERRTTPPPTTADQGVQCCVAAKTVSAQTEGLPPPHMVSDQYINKRGQRLLDGKSNVEERDVDASPSKTASPYSSITSVVGQEDVTRVSAMDRGSNNAPPDSVMALNLSALGKRNEDVSNHPQPADIAALRKQVRRLEAKIHRLTANVEDLTTPKTTPSRRRLTPHRAISPAPTNEIGPNPHNAVTGKRALRALLRRPPEALPVRFSTPPAANRHPPLPQTLFNSEGRRERFGKLAPLPLPRLAFGESPTQTPERRSASADTSIPQSARSLFDASPHQRFYLAATSSTTPLDAPNVCVFDKPFQVTPVRRNNNFGKRDPRHDIAYVTAVAVAATNDN